MGLAKTTRLNRIFSHSDGRIVSLAVDHFAGQMLPEGLRNVPATVERLMEAEPDAVTMIKGMAKSMWTPFAGRTPLILQSIIISPKDVPLRRTTSCEEALLLGADAIAIALAVGGECERDHLEMLSSVVEDAARFDLPVVAHIYPHDYSYAEGPSVLTDHESILWAVRAGVEFGADVIKVPFTGDVDGFAEIVSTSPVPVVCAGGPKTETLDEALEMVKRIVASGARGLVAGRNIWGAEDPVAAFRACRAIVHGP